MENENELDITAEGDEFEGLDPYAPTCGFREQKSSVNQLRRMYPDMKDMIADDDAMACFTLQRTLAYMYHLDQQFNLSNTFDNEHYERMKVEGQKYKDWLESDEPDPIWPPEGLKYQSLVLPVEDDEGDDEIPTETVEGAEPTETVTEVPTEKKARAVSQNSRYQKGKAIFLEDRNKTGISRSETLKRMERELGLSFATANVYYSKYKAECSMNTQ